METEPSPPSSGSARAKPIRGRVEPRIWTPPLRTLNRKTSLGFECIEFASEVLGIELLGWQRWWLIHALEVDADEQFRFKTLITLVGRQSGKTTLLKIVTLWMMYVRGIRLVLGCAQSLDIAREAWEGSVELAEANPEMAAQIESVRKANGEQKLQLTSGSRYRITAASRSAGRGLSVDLLILDEVREHRDWASWSALSKTTIARPNSLIVCISNAGDDQSVVLNALRSAAIADKDPTLGIFEWSAPDDCEMEDPKMWAYGSPGLGYTISEQSIRAALATDPPAVFRTEVLCQKVDSLDQPVSPASWSACADGSGTLRTKRKVSLCLDVAPDSSHVTLAAAQVLDGGIGVRTEVVGAWGSVQEARDALPALLAEIPYSRLGWFPNGPGAVLAADLANTPRAEPIKQAVPTVCMGFVEQIDAGMIRHPADALLTAHVLGSSKLVSGDGFRFSRRGGNCDAAYAAAGAVHLERTAPAGLGRPRILISRSA